MDHDLGNLPPDWTAAKIGSVGDVRYGLGQPPEQTEDGIPMIRATNVKRGRISAAGLIRIKREAIPKSRNAFLKEGDIVVVRSGAYTGDVAMVTNEWAGSVAGYDLVVSLGEQVDPAFCSLNLLGDRVQNYFRSQSARSAQPHLNRHQLESTEIPLPPLLEQRRIAKILGVVQQAIQQQERLLALTAELKRALLDQLFTQGLRGESQKQTEIGPVPESWDVVELANAVEQIDYGFSAPIPKTPPANGVKIVSTADITKDGRLLYDQIRLIEAPGTTVKRLTLETGDVLFNWRNSAELIGKSAVFEEQDKPHVFASFILRIKCGERKSHNFFLAHLMNHFRAKGVFLKLARRAVNQANYNRNEISVLNIPLPTYQEQREIADTIRAVDARLLQHRQKIENLNELFRTVLHQLMTAQIRVNELELPELEAAAAE
jgi:type I restriction enzyme, S subunit